MVQNVQTNKTLKQPFIDKAGHTTNLSIFVIVFRYRISLVDNCQ